MADLTASQITKHAIMMLNMWGYYVWRNNNLAVRGRKFIGERGVPDIIGYHKQTGQAVYCEVKKVGDTIKPDQTLFMGKAKAAGAMCLIAHEVNRQIKLDYWTEGMKS
jgi:hypothetical protein